MYTVLPLLRPPSFSFRSPSPAKLFHQASVFSASPHPHFLLFIWHLSSALWSDFCKLLIIKTNYVSGNTVGTLMFTITQKVYIDAPTLRIREVRFRVAFKKGKRKTCQGYPAHGQKSQDLKLGSTHHGLSTVGPCSIWVVLFTHSLT